MEPSVVACDAEEATGVETGGVASIAAVLVDLNMFPTHPGGGNREAIQEAGSRELAAGFEFEGEDLIVEREQQVLQQKFARAVAAGLAIERGGKGGEFGREAPMVDVDAHADDGVSQRRGRRSGGLDEDASHLAVVQEEIVRPTDVGGELCGGEDRALNGQSCSEGEPKGVGEGEVGADEGAEVEAVPGSGMPAVTTTPPAGGLFVGDVDLTVRRTCGSGLRGVNIGRTDAGEVPELAGEAGLSEFRVEGFEVHGVTRGWR